MSAFKAVFWLLLGGALAVGSFFWGVNGVRSVVSDRALWQSGTPAPRLRVGGKVRTNQFILKTYQLDLEFQDAEGGLHRGREEFITLVSAVDQAGEPELRYDPADPSRFVLSWALGVQGGRWAAAALFLLVSPVMFLGALRIARRHWPRPAAPPPPVAPGAAG